MNQYTICEPEIVRQHIIIQGGGEVNPIIKLLYIIDFPDNIYAVVKLRRENQTYIFDICMNSLAEKYYYMLIRLNPYFRSEEERSRVRRTFDFDFVLELNFPYGRCKYWLKIPCNFYPLNIWNDLRFRRRDNNIQENS